VELELEEVWSARASLSASDAAVTSSVFDDDEVVEIEASLLDAVIAAVPVSGTVTAADDVAETNACAFWI
jgi:hypothetical protein